MDAEWSKKCAVILLNELKPRADKLGLTVSEFLDPKISGPLARAEYEGLITRKELRSYLDERVKRLNDKRPR